MEGISGYYAAKFNSRSRLAIFANGPHTPRTIVSYSLWIKTSKANEMVLVHYGSNYGVSTAKSMFTVTLSAGTPILYQNAESKIIPKEEQYLNDNEWHHIAVTMPKKKCLLSEVIMYIDGKIVDTNVHQDEYIFFIMSGSISIGGFGHTSKKYETLLTAMGPFVGLIDDFRMWSRTLKDADLLTGIQNNLKIRNNRMCRKMDGQYSKVSSQQDCERLCLDRPDCKGFQLRKNKIGNAFNCVIFIKKKPVMGARSRQYICARLFPQRSLG